MASNLKYGRPEATDGELWEALEIARAANDSDSPAVASRMDLLARALTWQAAFELDRQEAEALLLEAADEYVACALVEYLEQHHDVRSVLVLQSGEDAAGASFIAGRERRWDQTRVEHEGADAVAPLGRGRSG